MQKRSLARCSRDAVRNHRIEGRCDSRRESSCRNGGQEGASEHLTSIESDNPEFLNLMEKIGPLQKPRTNVKLGENCKSQKDLAGRGPGLSVNATNFGATAEVRAAASGTLSSALDPMKRCDELEQTSDGDVNEGRRCLARSAVVRSEACFPWNDLPGLI